MARTFIRQDDQLAASNTSNGGYLDNVAPSLANYETNPNTILDDLNNLRSVAHYLKNVQTSDWYTAQVAPTTLETGVLRGVDNLNDALHLVEKKRILRDVYRLVDVTVPNGQNYVILGTGELPSNTTAAVGAVTTLGTVVAFNATFGAHTLDEVAGVNAINPKNLMNIVDASTRDPIQSDNRVIYGLFQSENNTNGHTITDTTPDRVQISFVRINATGDDLEAVPVAHIEDVVINYAYRERVRLEDLTEEDFLRGGAVDVPGSTTVTRQVAYDNQGTTPVELGTNATLDLNSTGIFWEIRDLVNATLFRITEGSTGGTTTLQISTDVDTFDVNAVVNDFNSGATFNSGGTRPIAVGTTDGVINSTAGDLRILATTELYLDDGNQAGSTWAQTDGIKLSDTTQEWDDFETAFGEVSLLNAIYQAGNSNIHLKTYAVVTANVAANADVSGPSNDNNLDVDLGDLSQGNFINDYDLYLNGVLLRAGADAAANHDYYPGTALANGQLRFEFTLKGTGAKPDQLTLIRYVP